MINLDDISVRVDRGQYVEADVQALLGEAQNPDSGILDRISKGFRNLADIRSLYANVEQLYASKFGRPTTAQRVAADQVAGALAKSSADAARFVQSQAVAIAQINAQAAWQSTAQTTQQAQQDQITAQAAVQQFVFTQAATADLVAQRTHIKETLVEQLGDALPSQAKGNGPPS